MAVDKIYPKRLNLDDDVRLLEDGDMVNAENATLTKQGDKNTNGVLSSAYGNTAVGGVDVPQGSTVIGSVSDTENQCIYFFTKGIQAIYKYTYGGGIALVFQSTWLNFNNVSFVKADVISGNFGQRETPETILYFTDGVNPPRKINVDRAIAGDYNGYSDNQLDMSMNCIKGALTYPFTFRFESDEGVQANNLKTDSFQFASQLIYTDGEESALSSYSSLAASKYYFDQGVGDPTLFSSKQNVCIVQTNWSSVKLQYKDVVKIRILARRGNTGNFFVLDELPVNENIIRDVYGESRTIWNSGSGYYKFYNDVIYDYAPEVTVNKLYDAVPFTATGQAVAQNRLFFSDYTEFRANGDDNGSPIVAYLDPIYTGDRAAPPEYAVDSFDYPSDSGELGSGFIDVNLNTFDWANDGSATSSTDIIPANSNVYISFTFNPTQATLEPDALVVDFYGSAGYPDVKVGFDVEVDFGQGVTIVYQDMVSQETTVAELALQYAEFLENIQVSVQWGDSGLVYGSVTWVDPETPYPDFQVGDVFTLGGEGWTLDATLKFEVSDNDTTDAIFKIKPYVSDLTVLSIDPPTNFNYYSGDYVYYPGDDNGKFSNINNTDGYIANQLIDLDSGFYSASFKAGSSHDIGVVYYDKYNRSGFVNKLGSFYAKHFSERTNQEGKGAVGVKVSFDADSHAPSWAESYQIVYTGRNTYSDFTTYTTGGAYPEKDSSGTLLHEGKLYVSLKTLDFYQKEKSAIRDYSFTKGDKLRVVSYDEYNDATYTTTYPKANDGSIIEFDIVDVVTLGDTNNPLKGTDTSVEEKYKGTFLVLDHPDISSGNVVTVSETEVNLKYIGFDWYQVTGTNYPNGDSVTPTNYWGRNCIVELLTPRQSSESRPYYEIGERYPIVAPTIKSSNHGTPISVFNGDVWWKKVACKSATASSATEWNVGGISKWGYFRNYIESSRINDFKSSEDWSKGRAHYIFDQAATFRRYNGITYSDAYEQDAHNLSLSSFNLSLSNFSYIDRQFGALNYIGNFNGNLVGIQDNKMSLIPIKSNIISYSDGDSGLAISTDVINKEQYASGDFGVSKKDLPSVLQKDNQVYFFDRSRNAILRYSGDQLTPITEKGVKNFFYQEFNNNLTANVVSGYDPLIDSYFFTKKGDFTISYNVPLGVWQSFHSFQPDFYAYMNDTMFTFKPHALTPNNGDMMWSHGGTSWYPKYYGSNDGEFVVEVYSKINPSKVKTFNAISVESDRAFRANVSSELNHSEGNTLIESTLFVEKEGVFYSQVYKKMDDSHLFYAGKCTAQTTTKIETDKYLGRHALPIGANVYYEGDQGMSPPLVNTGNNPIIVSSYGSNEINVSPFLDIDLIDKEIYVGGPSPINGSHLRGRWMRIKLSSASPNSHIYCINAHIAESKLTHTFNQ